MAANTRKNIRVTKDYRIYVLSLNAELPDLAGVKVNGRKIHITSPDKKDEVFNDLLEAFVGGEFCSIGSYAREILEGEHGAPDYAVLLRDKDTKEILGAAITMQKVEEELFLNGNTPEKFTIDRDPASLYIEVLCGSQKVKGAGSILLDVLNAMAKALGRTHLALTATPTSKPFYEYLGFVCAGARGNDCTKPLYTGGKRKTRRQYRRYAAHL